MRGAIVVSTYHDAITGQLERDAIDAWSGAGGETGDLRVLHVAGAFELPVACAAAARWEPRVDVIVALGCVIKGETSHDQYINAAVATGLTQIAIESLIPVAFGVLTCASFEEAQARCDGSKGRKGAEAMVAAIATAMELKATAAESVT